MLYILNYHELLLNIIMLEQLAKMESNHYVRAGQVTYIIAL